MKNNKLYLLIKNYLLDKYQRKINNSALYQIKTNSFAQFRKIQRNSKIKKYMRKLKVILELSDKELRILEMGLVIKWHPENLFGNDKSKWHPYDELIYNQCNILVVNLISLDIIKLKLFLTQYIKNFLQWKEGDKNRTIEGIITSYHYRSVHLDKIKNDDNLNNEEKILVIKTLNQELESLIKSLKMIDKNFPINYLKTNHQKLKELYQQNWIDKYNEIKEIVINSYSKYLKEEFTKGNNLCIKNEIESICQKILTISPKNILSSLSNKLSSNKINNIFDNEKYLTSSEFITLLLLIIDTIIVFDSPDNDSNNYQWKIDLIEKMENLLNNLPSIIIDINKKLDEIHFKIKQFK